MPDDLSTLTKWDQMNRTSPAERELRRGGEPLSLAAIDQRMAEIKEGRQGLIAKVQAGQLERKAALQEMAEYNRAHLAAVKHVLKRAAEVDTHRVDLIAQKYIYRITQEHLGDMQRMGIRNFTARMETLTLLNNETARLLEQAEGQDVPDFIKQKTVDAILMKYDEFFSKITADDINLS